MTSKLAKAAIFLNWVTFGLFALLLTAAIGGALLALVGAIVSSPELESFGGYMAGFGAASFFLLMWVGQPFIRLIASAANTDPSQGLGE